MRDVIKSMPDSIAPLLTTNNRLDMIDYLDANMKAEVRNKLNGTSELTKLTDTEAHIKMTSHSDLKLEFIDKDGERLVKVTHTYRIANKESEKIIVFKPQL